MRILARIGNVPTLDNTTHNLQGTEQGVPMGFDQLHFVSSPFNVKGLGVTHWLGHSPVTRTHPKDAAGIAFHIGRTCSEKTAQTQWPILRKSYAGVLLNFTLYYFSTAYLRLNYF